MDPCQRIRSYLPEDTSIDIARSNIYFDDQAKDMIVWNHPKEVEFSVKSAYKVLTNDTHSSADRHWERIWKWPGSQRNRTFMWLYAKNKILTNVQRVKRNITLDPLCPICIMEDETTLHALRDCQANKEVWKLLINPAHWAKFFSGDINNWFSFNSSRELGKIKNINWKITFAEAVQR